MFWKVHDWNFMKKHLLKKKQRFFDYFLVTLGQLPFKGKLFHENLKKNDPKNRNPFFYNWRVCIVRSALKSFPIDSPETVDEL